MMQFKGNLYIGFKTLTKLIRQVKSSTRNCETWAFSDWKG